MPATPTTPDSKKSGPQRKSPTISDRTDMTIEFQPDAAGDASRDAARDSAATIDSVELRVRRAARTRSRAT